MGQVLKITEGQSVARNIQVIEQKSFKYFEFLGCTYNQDEKNLMITFGLGNTFENGKLMRETTESHTFKNEEYSNAILTPENQVSINGIHSFMLKLGMGIYGVTGSEVIDG
jgi:hypothetical protein